MKIKLDKEEQALYKSLQKGEWQPVPDIEDYKRHLQKAAKNTVNKTQRINLRLTQKMWKRHASGAFGRVCPTKLYWQALCTNT